MSGQTFFVGYLDPVKFFSHPQVYMFNCENNFCLLIMFACRWETSPWCI